MKHERTENFDGWADDRTLARLFKVSRSTVWVWSRDGVIPPPVKIGRRMKRWDISEVRAAVAEHGEKQRQMRLPGI